MLSAGASRRLEGVELIPIEDTRVSGTTIGTGMSVFATKAPVAIVVRSRRGIRALDLEGHVLPLESLLRDVAGLAERLASTGQG